MSKSEWVTLGNMSVYGDTYAAVDAVLRCRRIVEVRRTKAGGLAFFARVPLPGKAARVLIQSVPSPEGPKVPATLDEADWQRAGL